MRKLVAKGRYVEMCTDRGLTQLDMLTEKVR